MLFFFFFIFFLSVKMMWVGFFFAVTAITVVSVFSLNAYFEDPKSQRTIHMCEMFVVECNWICFTKKCKTFKLRMRKLLLPFYGFDAISSASVCIVITVDEIFSWQCKNTHSHIETHKQTFVLNAYDVFSLKFFSDESKFKHQLSHINTLHCSIIMHIFYERFFFPNKYALTQ